MSHKNKVSLVRQVEINLTSKLCVGRSKHLDKKQNATRDKIYSYSTLKDYLKWSCAFVKYCKENHRCKTLEECRPFVDDFLSCGINRGLSAYTLKLQSSALAKLYICSTLDFITTPQRKRSDITRSRKPCERDRHFSEKKNSDFITFCRSTGLRRSELTALKGYNRKYKNGKLYVIVRRGKGGKFREVPVIGDKEKVLELMRRAGSGRVFENVPQNTDIHSFRADYARRYYDEIARPLETLSKNQKYYCRGDMKGVVFDRAAMMQVSRALGHSRINIIAEHYLWK